MLLNAGTRILVIDDEPLVLESISAYFQDLNHKVYRASGGDVGLEMCAQEDPEVVLTDLRMPGTTGLEVISSISRDYPDKPIIAVSGTGMISDAIEAVRAGAWDFVTKPISDMDVLGYVTAKSLERARLIRENRCYQQHLEDEVLRRTEELVRANKELAATRLQIIRRLGRAGEYKDTETGRHVLRVSQYSKILAEGMGLDSEIVDLIHETSLIHDIGKIGVPDRVLLKRGKLDEDEWQQIKQHSRIGADMLRPVSHSSAPRNNDSDQRDTEAEADTTLLRIASNIAGHHHERWDGTGYPDGLSGEQIPLAARIVAVADTYDALISRRPYKDPLPQEECEEIIRKAAGNHLDPNVVDVFFKSIDKIVEVKRRWMDDGQ